MLPAGQLLKGRDGRAFSIRDQQAILAHLASLKRPVLLDENHSAVHRAPRGESSPAAGWLSDFKFEAAGLSAAVQFTPYGRDLIATQSYRYLSPALLHDAGVVIGLHSVALTNDPNLELPALNSTETVAEQVHDPDRLRLAAAFGCRPEDLEPASDLESHEAPEGWIERRLGGS